MYSIVRILWIIAFISQNVYGGGFDFQPSPDERTRQDSQNTGGASLRPDNIDRQSPLNNNQFNTGNGNVFGNNGNDNLGDINRGNGFTKGGVGAQSALPTSNTRLPDNNFAPNQFDQGDARGDALPDTGFNGPAGNTFGTQSSPIKGGIALPNSQSEGGPFGGRNEGPDRGRQIDSFITEVAPLSQGTGAGQPLEFDVQGTGTLSPQEEENLLKDLETLKQLEENENLRTSTLPSALPGGTLSGLQSAFTNLPDLQQGQTGTEPGGTSFGGQSSFATTEFPFQAFQNKYKEKSIFLDKLKEIEQSNPQLYEKIVGKTPAPGQQTAETGQRQGSTQPFQPQERDGALGGFSGRPGEGGTNLPTFEPPPPKPSRPTVGGENGGLGTALPSQTGGLQNGILPTFEPPPPKPTRPVAGGENGGFGTGIPSQDGPQNGIIFQGQPGSRFPGISGPLIRGGTLQPGTIPEPLQPSSTVSLDLLPGLRNKFRQKSIFFDRLKDIERANPALYREIIRQDSEGLPGSTFGGQPGTTIQFGRPGIALLSSTLSPSGGTPGEQGPLITNLATLLQQPGLLGAGPDGRLPQRTVFTGPDGRLDQIGSLPNLQGSLATNLGDILEKRGTTLPPGFFNSTLATNYDTSVTNRDFRIDFNRQDQDPNGRLPLGGNEARGIFSTISPRFDTSVTNADFKAEFDLVDKLRSKGLPTTGQQLSPEQLQRLTSLLPGLANRGVTGGISIGQPGSQNQFSSPSDRINNLEIPKDLEAIRAKQQAGQQNIRPEDLLNQLRQQQQQQPGGIFGGLPSTGGSQDSSFGQRPGQNLGGTNLEIPKDLETIKLKEQLQQQQPGGFQRPIQLPYTPPFQISDLDAPGSGITPSPTSRIGGVTQPFGGIGSGFGDQQSTFPTVLGTSPRGGSLNLPDGVRPIDLLSQARQQQQQQPGSFLPGGQAGSSASNLPAILSQLTPEQKNSLKDQLERIGASRGPGGSINIPGIGSLGSLTPEQAQQLTQLLQNNGLLPLTPFPGQQTGGGLQTRQPGTGLTLPGRAGTTGGIGQNLFGRRPGDDILESNATSSPMIQSISVSCDMSANTMDVLLNFDQPFDGLVYAKNYFKIDICRQNANRQTQVNFRINLDTCGMFTSTTTKRFFSKRQPYQQSLTDMGLTPQERQRWFENVVVIMNNKEAGILEAWDKAYKVSCGASDFGNHQMKLGITVPMIPTVEAPGFEVKLPDTWMKIVRGMDPNAEPVNQLTLGEMASLIVIRTDPNTMYDIHLYSCTAHDGSNLLNVELLDTNGCPVHSKIVMPQKRGLISTGELAAILPFNTFKFPDEQNVFFKCEVQLCFENCQERPCPNQIRGKREAVNESEIITPSKTQNTIDFVTEAPVDSLWSKPLFQSVEVILPEQTEKGLAAGPRSRKMSNVLDDQPNNNQKRLDRTNDGIGPHHYSSKSDMIKSLAINKPCVSLVMFFSMVALLGASLMVTLGICIVLCLRKQNKNKIMDLPDAGGNKKGGKTTPKNQPTMVIPDETTTHLPKYQSQACDMYFGKEDTIQPNMYGGMTPHNRIFRALGRNQPSYPNESVNGANAMPIQYKSFLKRNFADYFMKHTQPQYNNNPEDSLTFNKKKPNNQNTNTHVEYDPQRTYKKSSYLHFLQSEKGQNEQQFAKDEKNGRENVSVIMVD